MVDGKPLRQKLKRDSLILPKFENNGISPQGDQSM